MSSDVPDQLLACQAEPYGKDPDTPGISMMRVLVAWKGWDQSKIATTALTWQLEWQFRKNTGKSGNKKPGVLDVTITAMNWHCY